MYKVIALFFFVTMCTTYLISGANCTDTVQDKRPLTSNEITPSDLIVKVTDVSIDSFTIQEVLELLKVGAKKLATFDKMSFELGSDSKTYEDFDFLTKNYLGSGKMAAEQNGYKDFGFYKNIWTVSYRADKNKYDFLFFDTLGASVGIGSVTYYDNLRKRHETRSAPGMLYILHDRSEFYFIGIYNGDYKFNKITAIFSLDSNLYAMKQMRFGRMPMSTPKPEFVSLFEYDSVHTYLYETELRCSSMVQTYNSDMTFFKLVQPFAMGENCTNIGTVSAEVSQEVGRIYPWIWSTQVIYDY